MKSEIKVQQKFLENSFLLSIIAEWNDLDYSLWNAPSIYMFRQNNLMFIHFNPKPMKSLVINKNYLDKMCICEVFPHPLFLIY